MSNKNLAFCLYELNHIEALWNIKSAIMYECTSAINVINAHVCS